MDALLIVVAALLVLAVVGWIMLLGSRSHTNPHITVGRRLPSFVCKREDGSTVSSDELVCWCLCAAAGARFARRRCRR